MRAPHPTEVEQGVNPHLVLISPSLAGASLPLAGLGAVVLERDRVELLAVEADRDDRLTGTIGAVGALDHPLHEATAHVDALGGTRLVVQGERIDRQLLVGTVVRHLEEVAEGDVGGPTRQLADDDLLELGRHGRGGEGRSGRRGCDDRNRPCSTTYDGATIGLDRFIFGDSSVDHVRIPPRE